MELFKQFIEGSLSKYSKDRVKNTNQLVTDYCNYIKITTSYAKSNISDHLCLIQTIPPSICYSQFRMHTSKISKKITFRHGKSFKLA